MTHSYPDEDQRQRFIDAARELGCEEGFDRLDEALKRVGTTPPQPQRQPRSDARNQSPRSRSGNRRRRSRPGGARALIL